MKIISGKYKGKKIEGYDLPETRPTMDRVKESLFAMIQEKIKGSIVLDLFSGSGNLAIEAISEGASFAYLVDKNKFAIKAIKKNVASLQINNCKIINTDYQKALKILKNNNIQLDLIFLDPPYKTFALEKSIKIITEYQLLKNNGLLICESNDKEKIIYPNQYKVIKEKKYGDKWICILKKI